MKFERKKKLNNLRYNNLRLMNNFSVNINYSMHMSS